MISLMSKKDSSPKATTIRATPEVVKMVNRIAASEGVSSADVVSEILAKALKDRYRKALDTFVKQTMEEKRRLENE